MRFGTWNVLSLYRASLLRRYKSPDIDQIPAELIQVIQVGGNTLYFEIH
jgi:hypothetical protein